MAETTIRYFGIAHHSVVCADLQRSVDFYVGLLGMPVNPQRPELNFDGAWLRLGEQEIHLLVLPNPDPVEDRPVHVGRDRHVALRVERVAVVREILEQAGIPFTLSRSGRNALFCRDPDGNGLEFVEA